MISEVIFSSKLIEEFKQRLINYLLSDKFTNNKKLQPNDLDIKYKDIINLINLNAPIKIISQNKKNDEILIMFNELINEMKKIELRERVESLENEVSLNLDEKLYSELLSLRNQLKSG